MQATMYVTVENTPRKTLAHTVLNSELHSNITLRMYYNFGSLCLPLPILKMKECPFTSPTDLINFGFLLHHFAYFDNTCNIFCFSQLSALHDLYEFKFQFASLASFPWH